VGVPGHPTPQSGSSLQVEDHDALGLGLDTAYSLPPSLWVPSQEQNWHVQSLGLAREVAQCQPLLIANLHWNSKQSPQVNALIIWPVLPQTPWGVTTRGAVPRIWSHSLPGVPEAMQARGTHTAPGKAGFSLWLIGMGGGACFIPFWLFPTLISHHEEENVMISFLWAQSF
jgi:hypothetical protein